MTEPNIFHYATSELSQDAAVAYHLAWADPKYKITHPEKHAMAVELLLLFLGDRAKSLGIGSAEIEVGLQYDHVDIWVHIGCEAVLIIEDKTNTSEHGGQIDRYRGVATKWKDPKGNAWGADRVITAYLKTGNESQVSAPSADYINKVDRTALLKVLNEHTQTDDDIIDQFRTYLNEWEDETKSYLNTTVGKWSWRGVEGFYTELEKVLKRDGIEINGWNYVSNAAGGFLAFYFGWQWLTEFKCQLYLQIENGSRVQIRVSDAQDLEGKSIRADADLRWGLLASLQEVAKLEKYSSLSIVKSGTYRPGWTGGVAFVNNLIATDENELIDIEATVSNLKLLTELVYDVEVVPNKE